MKNLTQLINAPLEAEDLLNIKDELVAGLNNITANFSSTDDIGELPPIIAGLEAINFNDISEITSLINAVMGYFKMGKSCDFSGEIGTFPTRDEFCKSTLGTAFMKNAMTCPIHQETHEEYTYLFHDLINPSNITWNYEEENVREGKQLNGKKSRKPKKAYMDIDDFGKQLKLI